MAEEIKRKSQKTAIIITYVIALLCLIAGLFVPLYGEIGSNAMLIQRLPDAVNKALGSELIPAFSDWFVPFEEALTFPLFGQAVNIFAWCTVLYAVITVIGLFFLIPVIAGNKYKRTSAGCAYFIEAFAAVVLVVYYLFKLGSVPSPEIGLWNLNTLIALGGTLIILIIQSIMTKKGLGAAKLFLFLFSAISALMLFDITLLITALADPLASIASPLHSTVGFIGKSYGWTYTLMALNPQELGVIFESGDWKGITLTLSLLIVAAVVFINIIIDTLALATGSKFRKNGAVNYHKGSKIFALVRYSLLLLALVVAAIFTFVIGNIEIGLFFYVIALMTLIQFIMTVIRLVLVRKAKKAAEAKKPLNFNDSVLEAEHSEDLEIIGDGTADNYGYGAAQYTEPEDDEVYGNYSEPEPEPEPVREQKKPEPAPAPAPAPAPVVYNVEPEPEEEEPESYFDGMDEEPEEEQMTIPVQPEPSEETHTIDYKVKYVYNGPSDEFMDTLTDEEKIEFSKTFFEKNRGNLPRIPDYEISGDNEDFFRSIFIYLNKFRSLLSPELLNKIYKYMNEIR